MGILDYADKLAIRFYNWCIITIIAIVLYFLIVLFDSDNNEGLINIWRKVRNQIDPNYNEDNE